MIPGIFKISLFSRVFLFFVLLPFSGGLFGQDKEEISRIISSFATKEKEFRTAWLSYTYLQSLEMKIHRSRGRQIHGQVLQMDTEVYFDSQGQRKIRITRHLNRLKEITFTREDEDVVLNLQPFVLTTDDLNDYSIEFSKKERVDELDCFVFQVEPKRMSKGRFYFSGKIWVDQKDLQIVMTRGKPLPEPKGQRFPEFETRRELIDGKYWFPTWTEATDILRFPDNQVEISEIVTYGNYRKFNVDATITFEPQVKP